MSSTKAIKLDPADAAQVADAAAAAGWTLSLLVTEALEAAVEDGLGDNPEPLAAGSKVIGPRLNDRLIAAVERKAAGEGISFGAYTRAALGVYLDELDDEDEADEQPGLVAAAVATTIRRLVPKQPQSVPRKADSVLPAPRPKGRSGPLVAVSGCLHVTDAEPGPDGYVLCTTCGLYAPAVEPGSPLYEHVRWREELASADLARAGEP